MSTEPTGPSVRSYRPGAWYAVLGERALVALPPALKPRVAALWELVDGGAGFDVTLDALISGGLRDLPGFVLVSTGEGETRIVLRGAARAELVAGGETVALEGSSATTWVERSLTGVERMTLFLTGDADTEPDAEGEGLADALPTYVVDGGLFRVSRLDESPAHEGEDELHEEPAYEREFPLTPADDLEPEPEPEPAPVRSPEPPDWTPAPPSSLPSPPPLPPSIPPPPPEPPVPPLLPGLATEAMPVPVDDHDPGDDDADHDGHTVTGAWEPPSPPPPGIPGQEPAPDVTRPVARLSISNGDVVEVDRAVVIGRAPESRRSTATEQPRLVTVPSPQLEISSTHVEVRPGSGVDHGSAVVTDLGSTNGTVLVLPGLPPEELVPGVAVQLVPGSVIDLGDGVTIQVSRP